MEGLPATQKRRTEIPLCHDERIAPACREEQPLDRANDHGERPRVSTPMGRRCYFDLYQWSWRTSNHCYRDDGLGGQPGRRIRMLIQLFVGSAVSALNISLLACVTMIAMGAARSA